MKATKPSAVIPGQYIIVLRENVTKIPAVASEMAKTHAGQPGNIYKKALKGFSIHLSEQAAEKSAKDPRVRFIEQDKRVTVGKPEGKGKPPKGQKTPWGYNAHWRSGTSMAAPHVAGLLLLGNISHDGTAINDPDGHADAIAHK